MKSDDVGGNGHLKELAKQRPQADESGPILHFGSSVLPNVDRRDPLGGGVVLGRYHRGVAFYETGTLLALLHRWWVICSILSTPQFCR